MLSYRNHLKKLEQLKQKQFSLKENVTFFLSEIEKKKHLNAFLDIYKDEAILNAEKIQKKIENNQYGKLAGMVVAIKDVLHLKDHITTCSSKILQNFESLYTATAVQKLIDEDAIIIGKTNCDEFAMGSSNENSAFGNVLNPINETKVPGGSSGGSAAAVAAGLCDAALGTDTGGSIRQPASFCGVFGLKPTYSLVSRYGLTAFASSFDSIGPFTKNSIDTALILEVISGNDENDSTSFNVSNSEFLKSIKDDPKKLRIGFPIEYFSEGLDDEIKNVFSSLKDSLIKNGFIVEDISLPFTDYSIATYYILTTAEASSNLARYDGGRYGTRSEDASSLDEMYLNSRTEGFGAEVKRRIMLGTYVLSSGYYDAYYKKAQKVRRIIKNDFDNAFNKVDLILTPTSPTTAFSFGEKSTDPLEMYLSDIYTTSANLAGIPGISIPAFKSSNGLPIGVQLMANQFEEAKLLRMSYYLEKLFDIKI